MNKRIEELAISTGIVDCLCDPYDKLKNGDPYSSVLPDLERFAEMIIRECHDVIFYSTGPRSALNILEHFGVEE